MPAANAATVAVEYRHQETLAPGGSLRTVRTFVVVHQGDCFATLRDYRRIMLLQAVRLPDSPDNGFEPIWCAWRAVELRRLSPRSYRITDYVHGQDLGLVRVPKARLAVEFRGSLLIAAIPQQ